MSVAIKVAQICSTCKFRSISPLKDNHPVNAGMLNVLQIKLTKYRDFIIVCKQAYNLCMFNVYLLNIKDCTLCKQYLHISIPATYLHPSHTLPVSHPFQHTVYMYSCLLTRQLKSMQDMVTKNKIVKDMDITR